jgi:hypothetical protein
VSLAAAFGIVLALGLALAGGSVLILRASGARASVARKLAGAAEVKVGRLPRADALPSRPVRVVGRIRCRDPLEMEDGERLVAYHRDVEVRVRRGWRSIERLRETRSLDLWDHDGSLSIDLSRAAEPLIVIPLVWRGDPGALEEPHASALARLAEREGPATEARATTRAINVTDRLLVLAQPGRDDSGHVSLAPPDGGYLVTNLALDDAMRLLGGRNRRSLMAAIVGLTLSFALLAIGLIGLVLSAVLTS